jgi:EF hand
MTVTDLMRMTALATLVVTSATSGATAQTTEADPHRLNAILAQATPGQAPSVQPAQPRVIPAQPSVVPAQPSTTPAQPGMMQSAPPSVQATEPGMTRPGMMGQGMMQPAQPGTPPAEAGMMRPGMMGHGMMGGMPMMGPRGHMMKVMFAIADTNGDGALSFEEVAAVHKRIFERVDANKDGKVSPEEIQIFMRE